MLVLTNQQADEMLSRLTSYCKEYSLSVTDVELRKCIQHLDLVLETNKTTNLTRILNVEDAAVLHILDSLVLLPYINKAPEGALLDMGTGAGFPGIPLTITTHRKATYIDSVGKKVDAVNSFVHALGLKHAHAVHDRLEEYARSHKKQFSVVTARALAPLPILVEYAAPYLKDGGLFVITKGNPSDEELASGMSAAKICGFTLLLNDAIDLPEGLGHREFIVLKKSHPASVSLPRANGVAKKNQINFCKMCYCVKAKHQSLSLVIRRHCNISPVIRITVMIPVSNIIFLIIVRCRNCDWLHLLRQCHRIPRFLRCPKCKIPHSV